MALDGAELMHAQKLQKTAPIFDECRIGNATEDKGDKHCLKEASCNSAGSSDSKKTASLRLFDICSSNKWNCPEYELSELLHPDQNIMFKYKVTVLVNTYSLTILQCFSAPKSHREAAQEHAAEGALWCLKHLGYRS